MTDQQDLPPMGWYPDPTDASQERYWEGTRWTHNVRDPQPDSAWSAGLGAAKPAADSAPHDGAGSGSDHAPRPRDWGRGQNRPDEGHAHRAPHQHQSQPAQSQQQFQPHQHQNLHHHQQGVPQGYVLGQPRPALSDGSPLAGFGSRFAARLIDVIAVTVISLPLSWSFVQRYWQIFTAEMESGRAVNQVELAQKIQGPVTAIGLIWVAVMFGYQLLMVGLTQKTLGKMALGLRVVPESDGRAKPTWGQALIRAITVGGAALIDMSLGFATLLTCLWALRKPKQQALQDRFARTQVVSKN